MTGLVAAGRALKPELNAIIESSPNFAALCHTLHGHNVEDGMFDFNYKHICATVRFDEETGKAHLTGSFEVYDENEEYVESADWEDCK
ncbi:MAG: hypothetical protein LBN00_06555 [Oscillospiraceae bacterium]|jgi:hypothetical protein|nr:hypothetical protein [Oscillospiraceae bacterium]